MFKLDLMPAGGGKSWDDGGCGQVAAILISYSAFAIHSLRFLYFKDGSYNLSENHGRLSGSSQMIRLDCPTEFLTEVHGFRSIAFGSGSDELSSITFVTNKSTYGPFGKSNPSSGDSDFKFRLRSRGDSINGFHGTINNLSWFCRKHWYLFTDLKPLHL
ncbi:unnamed protein product [Cuscuta epithymum]|uniref:Jacalin-type lectin domain-containing protein n=1 Tax=Cuscuta epithymum TaxID=186058 RepID=A0AAV0CHU8_9ASTE|nr:unnamed protein product [Cuscuta epithymum]